MPCARRKKQLFRSANERKQRNEEEEAAEYKIATANDFIRNAQIQFQREDRQQREGWKCKSNSNNNLWLYQP